MSFVHDDPDFDGLLQIVANNCGLGVALVEKDYWVTHTLWALHAQGFDIWFKGGTSLSKGFGLIERFSEDLDLKLEPGTVAALRSVTNWKSEGTKATAERKAHFEALANLLSVAGAKVNPGNIVDTSFRSATLQVEYAGKRRAALASVLRPFVLLEIGSARVTPFVARTTRPARCSGARASRSWTPAPTFAAGSTPRSARERRGVHRGRERPDEGHAGRGDGRTPD